MSGTHITGLLRRPDNLAGTPLHAAVHDLQLRHNWTDAAFAATLGMGRTHYCEFKYGKRELSLKPIRRLYALGIPADLLLK